MYVTWHLMDILRLQIIVDIFFVRIFLRVRKNMQGAFPGFVIVFLRTIVQNPDNLFKSKKKR